jgi:hypothetical protein
MPFSKNIVRIQMFIYKHIRYTRRKQQTILAYRKMEPIVLFKLLNYQNGFKTKTHLFNFKTLKNKKFGSLTPIYIKLKLKKTNQLKFITSGGQHKAKHFINIKRGTRKALLSLQNNKNFKSKHITQQNGHMPFIYM